MITYLLQSNGDGDPAAGGGIALGLLILLSIGFLLYMLPTLIAYFRHHRQIVPLGIVNFFFGWTFLGWVACLAWSFQSYKDKAATADNLS